MPEGDTIHRSARTLGRALTGRTVGAVQEGRRRIAGVTRLVGQTVEAVDARGKHLLIRFAPSGLTLHTHMMMSGAWHLYRPGQRWRKPPGLATVVLEVPAWVAVCFSAPVCELLDAAAVAAHPGLAGLGPDAVGAGTDLAEARRRLDERARWTVADALLDQRVLAGVGNVYKCEVLFLHGVHPWMPVQALPSVTRDELLATAERLLKANTDSPSGRRTTTAPGTGGRLHVYGRARRPCPRCATPVRVARQGSQARLTYWCPNCQPPGVDGSWGRSDRYVGEPRSTRR